MLAQHQQMLLIDSIMHKCNLNQDPQRVSPSVLSSQQAIGFFHSPLNIFIYQNYCEPYLQTLAQVYSIFYLFIFLWSCYPLPGSQGLKGIIITPFSKNLHFSFISRFMWVVFIFCIKPVGGFRTQCKSHTMVNKDLKDMIPASIFIPLFIHSPQSCLMCPRHSFCALGLSCLLFPALKLLMDSFLQEGVRDLPLSNFFLSVETSES